MKKRFYLLASLSLALFFSPNLVISQSMGGPGDKIYDNRLREIKPEGQGGTECRIENPEGLCTTYSVCP
jgi:hypothetical protein